MSILKLLAVTGFEVLLPVNGQSARRKTQQLVALLVIVLQHQTYWRVSVIQIKM